MTILPDIGVLPTGGMAFESPLLVIGTPALIALLVTLAVVVGVGVVAPLLATRQERPTIRTRRLPAPLGMPFGAPKGG